MKIYKIEVYNKNGTLVQRNYLESEYGDFDLDALPSEIKVIHVKCFESVS